MASLSERYQSYKSKVLQSIYEDDGITCELDRVLADSLQEAGYRGTILKSPIVRFKTQIGKQRNRTLPEADAIKRALREKIGERLNHNAALPEPLQDHKAEVAAGVAGAAFEGGVLGGLSECADYIEDASESRASAEETARLLRDNGLVEVFHNTQSEKSPIEIWSFTKSSDRLLRVAQQQASSIM